MTIDFHAHLAPFEPKAPSFLRLLFDLEGYLERQEAAGIERTVLSYGISDIGEEPDELGNARKQHDFLADLVSKHPGRFSALAGIDFMGGEAWIAEAERALDAGLAGICLPSSSGGRYPDGPEAQDLLALAEERRVVVFLHPSDTPFGIDRVGDPTLGNWIGRPSDTGICLSRMLLADTLAQYPNISLVVAHGGGVLPMLLGRLDWVYDGMQRRAKMFAGGGPPGDGPPGDGPPGGGPPGGGGPPPGHGPAAEIPEDQKLQASLDGAKPSERIGQLYLDTATYHPAAVRASIETVGVDRLVVGTDHPPVGDDPLSALSVLDEVGLSEDEIERVKSANARKLLGVGATA